MAPEPDHPAVLDAAWFREALSASSDIVIVLAPDTTIVWCNGAVERELGHAASDMVGRSLVEFLHPDDLERAADILTLANNGVFGPATPITPALYRARRSDGTWLDLDTNASGVPGDDHLLVVARTGGDLVLGDKLLEAVTGGERFETQVELVLALGVWRHPTDGYAIYYVGHDGERRTVVTNLPPGLIDQPYPGEPTPWDRELGSEPAVVDLGPGVTEAARAAGFVECLAAPVHDPVNPDGARILIWIALGGPTASGHHYDMATMRRALRLVLQQRAQVSLLERAARIDDLTGLVSRSRFFELLDRADAHAPAGARHALLYVDLDGFKEVNDSLGHLAGDEVLRVAADRLRAVAPPDAVVARLGGDEFVILCHPERDPAEAVDLADEVVTALAEPVALPATTAQVGASVGVAVGRPGEPARALLEAADQALFAAKSNGRGRWHVVP